MYKSVIAGVSAGGLCVGMVLLLELGLRLGRRRLGKDEQGARAGLGAVEGAIFALMGSAGRIHFLWRGCAL